MQTPLSRLIERYLKQQSLSRSQLAHLLGYHNQNKALRNLDTYCQTLTDKHGFAERLPKVLNIPDLIFQQAVTETQAQLDAQARRAFTPFIKIRLKQPPIPRMAGVLSVVPVNPCWQQLDFKQELDAVFKRYQAQQAKYAQLSWMQGNGFEYHRQFGETLYFSHDGQLMLNQAE